MPTKLSRYAEGMMEAAWIAALILTPLFFNKYSSRIFEPDKATLLRTLALVILGAWIIKIAENGVNERDPNKSWLQKYMATSARTDHSIRYWLNLGVRHLNPPLRYP